jgi:putative transposase
MYRLNFEKRVWIVKQALKGVPREKIGLAQGVSDRTVRELVGKYKEWGWDGLKDHRTGRPERVLNQNAQVIILDLRERFGYGACRIEQLLKSKGFSIAHRQIEKVLVRNNLVLPNLKKQKPRRWVRYELPFPNDLWHTDWTHDPFTDKNLSVYLDDRTRLITSFGIFENANIENSLALLRSGIASHGKPKAVMTDHGVTYYNNTPDKNGLLQLNTYQVALQAMGIKHALARINRPQTNGKVERFFLTYKQEYITGTFTSIKDYMRHYNDDRQHMSLLYKTPTQLWNELTERN